MQLAQPQTGTPRGDHISTASVEQVPKPDALIWGELTHRPSFRRRVILESLELRARECLPHPQG